MSATGSQPLARRAASALGIAVLMASVVVAGDLFGTRTALLGSASPGARPPAVSRASAFRPVDPASAPVRTSLQSSPWWQTVRSLSGRGAQTVSALGLSPDAIQVRLRWTCRSGRFTVRGAAAAPLLDAACSGKRTTTLPRAAGETLRITASGSWTARLEQQVDVPLAEAPTAAMRSATVAARGSLYRIDEVGQGRVTLLRLASGRYALRLGDVFVTPNTNLELRLSALARPRSNEEYLRAPSTFIVRLDVTAGSMNFTLPAGVDPRRYRSVVIWCAELASAYAAATLEPPR